MIEDLLAHAVPAGDCLIWTGRQHPKGYGVAAGGELAHRAAWRARNGPIPAGLCVCHRCDVRLCIRPDHLFVGTIGDNNRDAVAKGRDAHSEGQRGAKITFAQAEEIRAAKRAGTSDRELARRFGIDLATIGRIRRGLAYRAAPGSAENVARLPAAQIVKLSPPAVREIRRLAAAGVLQAELASRFGVVQSAISSVVNRRTWRNVEEEAS